MRTNCTPMTKQRLAILAVGLGFGILFSPLIASSAHAYKDPADFVRQFGARATKISGDSDLSAEMKRQAYREVLRTHFDLDRISDVVLGRHRRTATAGERATFRRLFDVYLIATNARRLEGFAGQRFQVSGARDKGPNGIFVASQIARPQGAPLRLVWRLVPAGESWQVIDVSIEGVSMLVTLRSEFSAVIRQSGGRIDGLIERLRTVIARLEAPMQQRAQAMAQ